MVPISASLESRESIDGILTVDGSSLVCALGCESAARESGTREA